MKTHAENIAEYLKLGGDSKKTRSLTSATLQNRARISYLLAQLPKTESTDQTHKSAIEKPNPEPQPVAIPERKKGVFSDFISQYPVELHATYKKRYEHWLEACSLKVKLNDIPEDDEEAALEIQEAIMKCFANFDDCQEALQYFNEKKRVLPTKSGKDFTAMDGRELLQARNLLRSSISKRKATIKKKQTELPDPKHPSFKTKQNALNRKLEELRDLELQEKELGRLLK